MRGYRASDKNILYVTILFAWLLPLLEERTESGHDVVGPVSAAVSVAG